MHSLTRSRSSIRVTGSPRPQTHQPQHQNVATAEHRKQELGSRTSLIESSNGLLANSSGRVHGRRSALSQPGSPDVPTCSGGSRSAPDSAPFTGRQAPGTCAWVPLHSMGDDTSWLHLQVSTHDDRLSTHDDRRGITVRSMIGPSVEQRISGRPLAAGAPGGRA